ncbi:MULTISPECIES: CS1 type fimbrial major subunit [Buttiauxella]|uniref:CS1 type fimbrial major subunit n=1 Tax=Buttiauxella TaxID=82976 RepID=UPI00105DF768|nr:MULTISPECIES: CS1 type fimbrial major subunit [Buttiauxella]TDN52960.1 hypothetical protein EC843_102398 [Buttiauxella sp. JUb87]UNK62113.1 CS1 type fimbrial major subunit [Buttiauxella ferragutiae]
MKIASLFTLAMLAGFSAYSNAATTLTVPLEAELIDVTQPGISADYTDGTWNNSQTISFGSVIPGASFLPQNRNVTLTVPANKSLKAKVTSATLINGSESIAVSVSLDGVALNDTAQDVVASTTSAQSKAATLSFSPAATSGKQTGNYMGNTVITVEAS